MRVVIGNDHGGVEFKREIVAYLLSKGYEVVNVGTDTTESVDYPDIAEKACSEFKKGGYDFGILICRTGIGISIAANKIDGIRAALVQDKIRSEMTKRHNNANFLCFGAMVTYQDKPSDIIESYLTAEFEGERHQKRLDKITALEQKGK